MSGQQVPNHYVQQFSSNIELKLQQKDSRLRSLVASGSHYGEQASPVDFVGPIEMSEVTAKFGPIGRTDSVLTRRWVDPVSSDLNQMLDSFDKLKLLTDPSSTYVQNAVNAAKRKQDRQIIEAFFADAKTGKTGSETTSFLPGNVIPVNHGASANVGLSVPKLIEGKKILMAAEVDIESDPIYCALTAEQHANLLFEIQIISSQYNSTPVLVNGMLKSWHGINFVHSELLAVDGSSYRRVPMWAKSGMYLGTWADMSPDISQRKDLTGHPWQAYIKQTVGATRLDEQKVVEIKCAE